MDEISETSVISDGSGQFGLLDKVLVIRYIVGQSARKGVVGTKTLDIFSIEQETVIGERVVEQTKNKTKEMASSLAFFSSLKKYSLIVIMEQSPLVVGHEYQTADKARR